MNWCASITFTPYLSCFVILLRIFDYLSTYTLKWVKKCASKRTNNVLHSFRICKSEKIILLKWGQEQLHYILHQRAWKLLLFWCYFPVAFIESISANSAVSMQRLRTSTGNIMTFTNKNLHIFFVTVKVAKCFFSVKYPSNK